MARFRYRFIHKISNPRPRKWDGVVEIDDKLAADRKALGALMRQKRLLDAGSALHSVKEAEFQAQRVELVAFLPRSHPYHCVVFELVSQSRADRLCLAGLRLQRALNRLRWARGTEAERLMHTSMGVNAPRIVRERVLFDRIKSMIMRVASAVTWARLYG